MNKEFIKEYIKEYREKLNKYNYIEKKECIICNKLFNKIYLKYHIKSHKK